MTHHYTHQHGMQASKLRYIIGGLGLIAVVITGLIVVLQHNQSPLPAAIDKQVSFVVFYPGRDWQVAPKDLSYSVNAGVLTLTAKQPHQILLISEQSTPSQFTDINEYYSTLLAKLNEYQSFGSLVGTVYLTRPTELGGGQEAVLNNNGTLLFAHPSTSLSGAQWQKFFNGVRLLK